MSTRRTKFAHIVATMRAARKGIPEVDMRVLNLGMTGEHYPTYGTVLGSNACRARKSVPVMTTKTRITILNTLKAWRRHKSVAIGEHLTFVLTFITATPVFGVKPWRSVTKKMTNE